MGAVRGGDQKENVAINQIGASLPPKRHGRAVLAPLTSNTLLCAGTPREMLKPADSIRTPLSRSALAPSAGQVLARTHICVSELSCAKESARGLTPDMKHCSSCQSSS